MKTFSYKAWDENFNITRGFIKEEDIDIVKVNLTSRGLKIIYVKEKPPHFSINSYNKKLNDEELTNFCGQTAMILNSGINLINGLEIIEKQTKKKNMKSVIKEIVDSVKEGNSLTSSMIKSGSFPRLLTDMIKAGETSGNLDTILLNMETFYKRETELKNKIKNASIYPTLILFVALGMVLFFNFFIFPGLKELFLGINLPKITIILIALLEYFNKNYLFIMVLLLIAIITIKYVKTIPKIKYMLDKIILRLPIVGDLKMNIITSRFTRSMGIFLKSAVPIITVMENLKLIVDNEFIAKKIETVKNEVITGARITDSIEKEEIFEALVTEMMKVGEETGQLDVMMIKLADVYDEKLETSINRIMSLVEPVLTLVIGGLVAVVIVAMALPIMEMTQTMQ